MKNDLSKNKSRILLMPNNEPCLITYRENFLTYFQHLVRVLLFLRFLLYLPYYDRTSVEAVRLLKETQLIRSSLIESLTREAKPYVQKRPNSRLEKVDTFPKKDKGRPDGDTCYHGEPEMLVVWFPWVKVK